MLPLTNNYYDNLDEYTINVPIDWYLKSQKLHFDAPNNYKQVSQITLTSTLESKYPFVFNMRLTTYRNLMDIGDNEGHDYEVNGLKIFIKRISFRKINAFQFELSSYKKQDKPQQFIISNIAIKYRITERVR